MPITWLVAAFFVLYSIYAVSRHLTYLTSGYDLGIFDQAVQRYSQLEAPIVPLKGVDYNIFGDHFHPIISLLSPLYWIWDDPRTLLIAQAALVAGSIIPVWAFARRRFTAVPALFVAAAYALSWPLQGMIDFDFHEIAFAIPLIALVIYLIDIHRYGLCLVTGAVLLLVREDMGALVVFVGILLLLRRRWWEGAVAVGLGLAGYVIATAIVLPAFSPTGQFAYWSYDALGPNLPSALGYVVRHPFETLRLAVTPSAKVVTLLWLLVPTGLLALLSPYLLLTVPFLAQRFLSSRYQLWGTEFHYSSVMAPIVAMAATDGAARLVRRWPRLRALPLVWSSAALAVACAGTVFVHAQFPFGRLLTGAAWAQTDRTRAISAILPMVPAGECVETDDRIAPQLTHRNYVSLPGIADDLATWLVLDLGQTETGYLGPTPQAFMEKSQQEGFTVVQKAGDIVLLHRESPVSPLCSAQS